MPRILYCARHCSPVEQCLLKGMRSASDATDGGRSAITHFAKLGLDAERAEGFILLIECLRQEQPDFDLLQSSSPFISCDELSLLAVLGQESKSISRRPGEGQAFKPEIKSHLKACGKILFANNILLRPRPIRKNMLVSQL